jgi:hypothetical protein
VSLLSHLLNVVAESSRCYGHLALNKYFASTDASMTLLPGKLLLVMITEQEFCSFLVVSCTRYCRPDS